MTTILQLTSSKRGGGINQFPPPLGEMIGGRIIQCPRHPGEGVVVVLYGIIDLNYIYNYSYNYNYDYNYTTHYISIKDSIIHDNAMQHGTIKYNVVQVHLFRKEKGGYHAMQGNAMQCNANTMILLLLR